MDRIRVKNQKLFNDIITGLKTQGYSESGGSDVFRVLLRDSDNACIKVFYKEYNDKDFMSMIVRYSYEGE